MKITDVRLGILSVPLRVPFKTALRTVNSVEDIIVEIHTDTGHIGYGEAPPTGAIIGDTTGAILGARSGEQALPEFYMDGLEIAEVLRELADDMVQGCPMVRGSLLFDGDWESKYLHGEY